MNLRIASIAMLATAMAACGSSGGRPRTDGGLCLFCDMAGADLAVADLAAARDLPPPMPDMGGGGEPDLAPSALRGGLVAGGSYLLGGVTSDDYVIAEDLNAANALVAMPAAGGGNTATIAISAPSYQVRTNSVFVWDGVNMNTHVGGLLLWSSQRAAQRISAASVVGMADASDDGQYIVYSSAADGNTSDVYVARADGTSARRVIASAQTFGSCTFHFQFAGSMLFVHYCASGDTTYSLARVDPATGSTSVFAANLAPKPFSADKTGTRVLIADALGAAFVIDFGNNNKNYPIDSKVADGILLPDGSAALVVSKAGELKRAPVQVSPPLSFLVPNGCNVIQQYFDGQRPRIALSPDAKYLLYSASVDAKTGLGDLAVSSTLTIDQTTLSAAKTAAVYGSAFTADSLRSLSHRGVVAAGTGYIGMLNSQALAGANPQPLATNSWAAYAASAARIAWNANWKSGKWSGRADLFTGSAAGGAGTPTAAQAEADFFLDANKSHVIYSISTGPMAGIYSATVQ